MLESVNTMDYFYYHFKVSCSTAQNFPLFDYFTTATDINQSTQYKLVEIDGNSLVDSGFPDVVFYLVCYGDGYIRFNTWSENGVIHLQPNYYSPTKTALDVYIQLPIYFNNIDNMFDMDSSTSANISTQQFSSSGYFSYVYRLLHENYLRQSYLYTQVEAESNSSVMFTAYTNINGTGSVYTATGRYYTKLWGWFITLNKIDSFYFIDKFIAPNIIVYPNTDSTFLFLFNAELTGLFNSLLVYNYDFNLLQNCNSVYMNLIRGQSSSLLTTYHLSTPSDFEYPDYMFTSFISQAYSSVLYSELSSVGFTFTNDDISSLCTFDNYTMYVDLGFDFNMIYSSHPLVTDNSIYDIEFEKPQYVEMIFTLYPFYIPVLEIIENIFIFVMFYCPIVSDLFNYIGLNIFISTLLTVVQFIVGLPLGQFIIALIGFFIFFNIVKSYMPVLYSSFGDTYDSIYDDLPHPYESFKNHIWSISQKDRDRRNRRLFSKSKVYKPNHRYRVKLKGYKLAPIVKQTRGVSSAMLINRDKVFGRHHKYRVKLKHFKALPKKKQLRGVSNPVLMNRDIVFRKDRKYKVKMKSYKPMTDKAIRLRESRKRYPKKLLNSLFKDIDDIEI